MSDKQILSLDKGLGIRLNTPSPFCFDGMLDKGNVSLSTKQENGGNQRRMLENNTGDFDSLVCEIPEHIEILQHLGGRQNEQVVDKIL